MLYKISNLYHLKHDFQTIYKYIYLFNKVFKMKTSSKILLLDVCTYVNVFYRITFIITYFVTIAMHSPAHRV